MGAGKGAGIFNIALVAWYIRAAVSYILDGSNNFASSLSLCVYVCVCVCYIIFLKVVFVWYIIAYRELSCLLPI